MDAMKGREPFLMTKSNGSNPPVAHAGSYRRDKMQPLTSRERQIALLACTGRSNKQIAQQFNVTEGSVKAHLHNVYVKLAIRNRTMLAFKLGVTAPTIEFKRELRGIGSGVHTAITCGPAVKLHEVVHLVRTGKADVGTTSDSREDRMDTHQNAPLTRKGREQMVCAVLERGMTHCAAARQFNTTQKTVRKWINRALTEGVNGLRDRSSQPHSLPTQIGVATCDAVESLRRQGRTQKQIAHQIGISQTSVSRILRRQPQQVRPRYEGA
jgi:DNA-binding NarL/FixJ family response regulator